MQDFSLSPLSIAATNPLTKQSPAPDTFTMSDSVTSSGRYTLWVTDPSLLMYLGLIEFVKNGSLESPLRIIYNLIFSN